MAWCVGTGRVSQPDLVCRVSAAERFWSAVAGQSSSTTPDGRRAVGRQLRGCGRLRFDE